MSSDLTLLIGSWIIYFLIHSLLSSLMAKSIIASRWPHWMPFYRLYFNGIAIFLLLVPLYLTFSIQTQQLWAWSGPWFWLANGLAVAAVIGFYLTLSHYDTAEFSGLRQIRDREEGIEDQEHFKLSPFHRYVRHPWYFFGLVIIWTRDMSVAMLITASLLTLYFVIGSRLEERKLVTYHGEVYRQYLRLVPGLFPLPWRWMTSDQAARLEQEAARQDVDQGPLG